MMRTGARVLARRAPRLGGVAPARTALGERHISATPASQANELFSAAPSPLQEFSVVYTDRALNHMSDPFKKAMNEMNDTLKECYNAKATVIIPGSGSYGMEAVARQFAGAKGKKAAVLRNGFFSYRWTQIFEHCNLGGEHTVLPAQAVNPGAPVNELQYAPHAVDKVVDWIQKEKPDVLFAPHIETSTGMLLPDDYITKVADAMHSVGGLMVLDCIASGTVWIDMEKLGVDALISAPQKGWTGPSCVGIVMLSERGVEATRNSKSDSFVCDLRKWMELMESYEAGGFMYHATMPTDALMTFRDVMFETKAIGFEKIEAQAWELGKLVRDTMSSKGLISVAAEGFQSPGVIVVHHEDAAVGGKFIQAGTQIAAGVPFMIGEPAETKTFRIGLFGIDKLVDPAKTNAALKKSLDVAVPTQKMAA